MKKCDHCGVRNPDNRTTCDFCGESLDTPSPLQISMNVTTDLNAQVAVNTVFALDARTQAYKICPVYQQSTVLNMMICAQCGHRFYTPITLPAQTQMFYPPFNLNHFRSELKTHWLLIAAMWSINIFCVVSSLEYRLNGNKPSLQETLFLIILDIPPIIIAIVLVYSRNKTDRVNGWIKLIIELIGFIIVFVVVYAAIAFKSTYK